MPEERLADQLAAITNELADAFSGMFSRETIEQLVRDTSEAFTFARIPTFVPTLVRRYARERLHAAAQASGKVEKPVPEVLFVCVHNAARSQMAAALLQERAQGRAHARCAGSQPAADLHPGIVEVMAEVGVSMAEAFPKPLCDELVEAADVVITMGCGDACPVVAGRHYEDWDVLDPVDMTPEGLRVLRDEIDGRVQELLRSIVLLDR